LIDETSKFLVFRVEILPVFIIRFPPEPPPVAYVIVEIAGYILQLAILVLKLLAEARVTPLIRSEALAPEPVVSNALQSKLILFVVIVEANKLCEIPVIRFEGDWYKAVGSKDILYLILRFYNG